MASRFGEGSELGARESSCRCCLINIQPAASNITIAKTRMVFFIASLDFTNYTIQVIKILWLSSIIFLLIGAHLSFRWLTVPPRPDFSLPTTVATTSAVPNTEKYLPPPYTDREVVDAVNTERIQAGLAALEIDTKLTYAAQMKANDMCLKQYWNHTSPEGVTPWKWIEEEGFSYDVAGENLARDFTDAATLVAGWMASPLHQQNIVLAVYTKTGVGSKQCLFQGYDTRLTVQLYSQPSNTQQVIEQLDAPATADQTIRCAVSERCGGGTVPLSSDACRNTVCCGFDDGRWEFYRSKEKCTQDQAERE